MDSTATPAIFMVAGAVVLLIGVCLLTWARRMVGRQRREAEVHTRTTGTVVELKAAEDMDHSTLYSPVIEFTASGGRTFRVECLGQTQINYPLGRSVTVHYDPEKPEKAGIVGEEKLGTALVTAFALGVAALGLLIVVIGIIVRWTGGLAPSGP